MSKPDSLRVVKAGLQDMLVSIIGEGLEVISMAFAGHSEVLADQQDIEVEAKLLSLTAVLKLMASIANPVSIQTAVQQVVGLTELWMLLDTEIVGGLRKEQFKLTADHAACLCRAYGLLASAAKTSNEEEGQTALQLVLEALERDPQGNAISHPLSILTLKVQTRIAELQRYIQAQ